MNATERIRSMRLVGLLRGVERPDELVSALAAAGVEVVEVTLETPGAWRRSRAFASAVER